MLGNNVLCDSQLVTCATAGIARHTKQDENYQYEMIVPWDSSPSKGFVSRAI